MIQVLKEVFIDSKNLKETEFLNLLFLKEKNNFINGFYKINNNKLIYFDFKSVEEFKIYLIKTYSDSNLKVFSKGGFHFFLIFGFYNCKTKTVDFDTCFKECNIIFKWRVQNLEKGDNVM